MKRIVWWILCAGICALVVLAVAAQPKTYGTFAGTGTDLELLNADNLGGGTIAASRFPAQLPVPTNLPVVGYFIVGSSTSSTKWADLVPSATGAIYATNTPAAEPVASLQAVTNAINQARADYAEIWVPAGAMNPLTATIAWATNSWSTTTDGQKLEGWDCDSATAEYAQFTLTLPDSWDAGTIKAKFHWKAVNATSGGCVWSVAGGSLATNETGGNTLGTAVTLTNTAVDSIEKLSISAASAAVTIGGSPAAGHLTWFRVGRLASDDGDTMANDARLIGVQIQFKRKNSAVASW